MPESTPKLRLAGLEPFESGDDGSTFVNVGERTNVTGSAKLRKLITAADYRGSQSHFRRLVARERPSPNLRLKTLPGEQDQVDWAHFGTVGIGRAERRLMAFVMVLNYSQRLFLRF